jgi:hypothetical protein
MKINAVRWLNFTCNPLVDADRYSIAESLEFEKSPHREVSVELFLDRPLNQLRNIGLRVDVERTQFSIGYYEDGWTELLSDGTLRSPHYDQAECVVGESIAYTWDDALQMLECNEDRESWSEGVVAAPIYRTVVCYEQTPQVEEVAEFFGLPVEVLEAAEF